MILNDADAIRSGFPNIATYGQHVRRQAQQEAEAEAASAQARHMAQQRARQQAAAGPGTILRVQGQISAEQQRAHDAQLAERRRLDALTKGAP